jgi:hypothetical protein
VEDLNCDKELRALVAVLRNIPFLARPTNGIESIRRYSLGTGPVRMAPSHEEVRLFRRLELPPTTVSPLQESVFPSKEIGDPG